MKKEETIAALAFHEWLAERGWKTKWHPGPPNQCPDMCVYVLQDNEPQKWAVEVTRLFQDVDWNGETRSERYLEVLVDQLCESLNRIIPQDTKVRYRLDVRGPFQVKALKTIEERAIAYIQSGRTEEECLDFKEAFEDELSQVPEAARDSETTKILEEWAKAKARFHISANDDVDEDHSNRKNSPPIVSTVWFHASAKTPEGALAGDIKSTLRFAIQKILAAKMPRLEKLDSYRRKIVLIVQEYGFAEPGRLTEVVAEFTVTGVDAIFLVDSSCHTHLINDACGLFTA